MKLSINVHRNIPTKSASARRLWIEATISALVVHALWSASARRLWIEAPNAILMYIKAHVSLC